MRILVGDTETTGLSGADAICQLAFIEVNPELEVLAEWDSLIDPEMPISPSAMGKHGITDADVEFAPTMKEAMDEILVPQFGKFENIVLIAHNAPFDRRFLKPWWDITHTVCTLSLAKKVYPEAPDHQLMTLKFYLGLETRNKGVEGAHSAAADTDVLFALFKRIVFDTGKDLFDLLGYAIRPEKVTHMTFGKHKGVALKDLPAKYREWLLSLDNLDESLRWSLIKQEE